MLSLCGMRRIRLRSALGCVVVFAAISFMISSKIFAKPSPFEMRLSVEDKIQTWDNLAHLVEMGSFSKNLFNESKNISSPKADNILTHEAELLPPRDFQEFLSASNSQTSKIILLNSSAVFQQGQTVAFRIDVFDENNVQLERGGDDVRVWMTDKLTKKSAVSSVIDLKNGSYIAHFKALFSGTLDVHASVFYPKEYLQIMMSLVTHHINGFVSALFQRGGDLEVTLCAPFRKLPNYTKICDFTKENNNLSWFCGHPINTNLSCSDWTSIRPLNPQANLPLSDAEQLLIDKLLKDLYCLYLSLKRYPNVKSIPTNLKVQVKQSANQPRDLPPCNKRTRSFLQSWIEKSPRGWIQNSKWYPSTCQATDIPVPKLSQCFSNSTILLLGDSNQKGIYDAIRKLTSCDESKEMAWPRSSSCTKSNWNFKIATVPHSYPLNARSKSWIPKEIICSTSNVDNIPAEGKYIILLHHYLGLSSYHPDIFKDRTQTMRDAVDHLLERNPQAFVAVRGPHFAIKTQVEHVIGGDNFVQRYLQILKEEYKKLWRDVLFIDGSDISIATQNEVLDLPDFAQFEMAHTFLAYACDFFSS